LGERGIASMAKLRPTSGGSSIGLSVVGALGVVDQRYHQHGRWMVK
jgi:hypothetical protein